MLLWIVLCSTHFSRNFAQSVDCNMGEGTCKCPDSAKGTKCTLKCESSDSCKEGTLKWYKVQILSFIHSFIERLTDYRDINSYPNL